MVREMRLQKDLETCKIIKIWKDRNSLFDNLKYGNITINKLLLNPICTKFLILILYGVHCFGLT